MKIIELQQDGLPHWIGLSLSGDCREWWKARHHVDTGLTRWLRSLDSMPVHCGRWLPNVSYNDEHDAMPMLRARTRQIIDWCGGTKPDWFYGLRSGVVGSSPQPVAVVGPRGRLIGRYGSVAELAAGSGRNRDWVLRRIADGRIGSFPTGSGRVFLDDIAPQCSGALDRP